MVSISSAANIRERTKRFCNKINNWDHLSKNRTIFNKIAAHLQKEYKMIPDSERVGKGRVYISRYVAKECYSFLKKLKKLSKKELLEFGILCLKNTKTSEFLSVYYFAMIFLSEIIKDFPEKFLNIKSILEEWGSNDDWKVREGAIYPIISGLKKNPEQVLEILAKWVNHKNEYIRRLVAESLRPKATVKWLRNPEKNDKVLEILTEMRKDPSLYVRKSVGNNIKDLSKYMPEKMLRLMESWLEQANIRVHEQLATEIGLTQEEKRLIWTIKQGMRWIKDKNPEFHDGLEQILGKCYLLYFDEKTNRLAKPPSKK